MSFTDILIKYRPALSGALMVTVKLALITWATGIFLGILIGVLAAKYRDSFGLGERTLAFLLSGIPILVFLFWAHYPLQRILDVVINPFYTAAAVLAIINTFIVSELTRSTLADFPEQYTIAARVCGLSPRTTFFRIQLPIISRQMIPALLPIQITMLHATLFASLISVDEIFRVCQRINASEYKPVEIYTALAALFLAVSLPVNGLAIWLKKRFTRDLSEV